MSARRKSQWTEEEVREVLREINKRMLIGVGIAVLVGVVIIGLVAIFS
ncbi:hypothetical protein GMA10_08270 [Kocuria koreensis]|jgi:nucleoside permease NupC|uniref:Uncharacterized protein n=1 Tax=Rothia koreensis TaxID=592378 RepID=A0A7K1LJ35_9MICC|nr:hypothetical protein [Rothia koreensis]MUN55205.1 hypothetical protein [Rothia koreensis]